MHRSQLLVAQLKVDKQRLALLAIIGGVTAIAFAPIFVRLSDVGPNAVAFWRLALATPLLWLWSARTHPDPQPPALSPAAHWMLLIPGAFFAFDLILWHWSITLTSVANATFLPNMAPLLVSLVAWRWLGERLRPLFAVGLAGALLGVALMVWASAGRGDNNLLGDAIALGTAFFYAGYLLTIKQLRGRYATSTLMLATALVASAIILAVALATGEPLLAGSLAGWMVLLALAWFSHIGGQGLITYSLAHLPAAFSSVTLLLQPVLAALFAWLVLAEAVVPVQALGGVLVIAGIVLARRGSSR